MKVDEIIWQGKNKMGYLQGYLLYYKNTNSASKQRCLDLYAWSTMM